MFSAQIDGEITTDTDILMDETCFPKLQYSTNLINTNMNSVFKINRRDNDEETKTPITLTMKLSESNRCEAIQVSGKIIIYTASKVR